MKKSLLAVFMSLAMIVSLTACGGGGSSEPAAEAAVEEDADVVAVDIDAVIAAEDAE